MPATEIIADIEAFLLLIRRMPYLYQRALETHVRMAALLNSGAGVIGVADQCVVIGFVMPKHARKAETDFGPAYSALLSEVMGRTVHLHATHVPGVVHWRGAAK
jgi:hypothetical protein